MADPSLSTLLSQAAACGLPGRQNPSDPFTSLYPTIAQNTMPRSSPQGLPHFTLYVTAMLISRGFFYWKKSPGDCGSPSQLDLSNVNFTKEGGSIAGAGLSAGLGLAGIGGLAAGGATLGLSVVVTAIATIFSDHAAAVANEQATLCKVSQIVNQVIPHVDSLVASGQISPSDAIAYIGSFVDNVNAQMQTIEKTCNAACFYQGVMNAHKEFVKSYYPALAPPQVAPSAPGAPPSGNTTAPGGVPLIGLGIAHTLSGVPAATSGLSFSFTGHDLILVGAVLLIVFIFLSLRGSNEQSSS